MTRRIGAVALLAFASACGGGTSGSTGGAPAPASAPRRDANVITRAEIDEAAWANTAFDLVQRLRPNYLRTSGPTNWSGAAQSALVRLNDQDMGDFGYLRQIQPSAIKEIRYYSAADATAQFGGVRGRPVIHVTIK